MNSRFSQHSGITLSSELSISSVFASFQYTVILENLTLLTELSHYGTVCQKLLFVLTPWIHLRIDWINFWQDQEVIFNWKADIVAGSRSQVNAILH